MRQAMNLDGGEYDVVVIGGGTSGANSAIHLASSGYKVLLAEKKDFGTGSTSRSTRILHCGLLYLRTQTSFWRQLCHPLQLGKAVRTAMLYKRSRAELIRTMPARFSRFRSYIPIYEGDIFEPWQLQLALKVIDGLPPYTVPVASDRISGHESLERPLLRWLRKPKELLSVHGFDEYTHDWGERMAVDNAIYARSLGADIENYVEVKGFDRNAEGAWSIELLDRVAEKRFSVTAKSILNATGIWVDQTVSISGKPAQKRLHPTKGAHIVVKLPDECRGLGIATTLSNGMPAYLVPFRDSHHFGPTDVEVECDLDDVYVTRSEADYLFEELHDIIPGAGLKRDDVISTWAGLRPWTNEYHSNKKRTLHPRFHDHQHEGLPSFMSLTGVSITAQREGARLVQKEFEKVLRPSGPKVDIDYNKISTFKPDFDSTSGDLRSNNSLVDTIKEIAERESVVNLDDLLIRRLGVDYAISKGSNVAEAAANILGDALNWNEETKTAQMERFRNIVKKTYQPRPDT